MLKDYNKRNKGDDESGDNTGLHDEHDYTEEKKQEEDVVETLMILAMRLLVGFLVYIRQLRWNQENNRAGGQGRVDGNEMEEVIKMVMGKDYKGIDGLIVLPTWLSLCSDTCIISYSKQSPARNRIKK